MTVLKFVDYSLLHRDGILRKFLLKLRWLALVFLFEAQLVVYAVGIDSDLLLFILIATLSFLTSR